ncbi:hypothetical protein K474DRAFT_730573 [Panus rudis PR-1116 ss-1]|nr:hypothetical protein K474DRAFT_730573 [Panus rudis PR-1116 ss-1]
MVVTRRAPGAPSPSSRTNSSQPVPRVKKTPAVPPVPSALANGTHSEAQPDVDVDVITKESNKPGKSKKGKHKKNKSSAASGFVDLLTRIFLLWFTIYTLSVCPTDEHLKSPVCRGLHEYRRLVLEPYIIPQFQRAIHHPAVAPYVEKVQPYAARAYYTAKPIVIRTKSEFDRRVVPQWNKHVVPQWNQIVIPAWTKHAVPHIRRVEQAVEPYRVKAVSTYQTTVQPYIQTVVYHAFKFQRQAQPYIILAAHKTYDGYQTAKPYAIPLWQRFQFFLSQLAQFLATQRRQYVDPHVKKIWERVIELSNGDQPIVANETKEVKSPVSRVSQSYSSVTSRASEAVFSKSSIVPQASEAVVGSASSVLPDIIVESESLPASIPTDEALLATVEATTSTAFAESASRSASSISSVASSAATSLASEASSSASSVLEFVSATIVPSASSVAEQYVASPAFSIASQVTSSASSLADDASSAYTHATSSVKESASKAVSGISSAAEAAHESAASVADTASSSVSEAVTAASSSMSSAASSATSAQDDDIDLEAFYAELGLGDSLLNDDEQSTESLSASQPIETETEEEKAERLRKKQAETAKKRADITARHTEWERQLDEAIQLNRKALRKALVALRKAAVAELKENVEIRKELESLEEDAEKYLKGAERYLANLKRENRPEEEKSKMWNKVVDKVDAKFQERLAQAESVVNGWYLGVVNKELEEVKKVSAIVRDIADRGQADIGLDYAWLDDVTYQDWQRYHQLNIRSENFTDQAHAIQNGTHPSPPINPVLDALSELQTEVEDTILGFETRLRRVKRHGERSFGAKDGKDPVDDEIVLDETVSILPIEDDAHKKPEEGETPANIPPVTIGRSKEEVVEALNRAAEQDGTAQSTPEDKRKIPDYDYVVESLAHEAEEEVVKQSSIPAAKPLHEEL